MNGLSVPLIGNSFYSMGALIYKIDSYKMRSWEINSKISKIFFNENYLKIKLQEKGGAILRITPYRAFSLKRDLVPNILRTTSLLRNVFITKNLRYYTKRNMKKKIAIINDNVVDEEYEYPPYDGGVIPDGYALESLNEFVERKSKKKSLSILKKQNMKKKSKEKLFSILKKMKTINNKLLPQVSYGIKNTFNILTKTFQPECKKLCLKLKNFFFSLERKELRCFTMYFNEFCLLSNMLEHDHSAFIFWHTFNNDNDNVFIRYTEIKNKIGETDFNVNNLNSNLEEIGFIVINKANENFCYLNIIGNVNDYKSFSSLEDTLKFKKIE